MELVVEKEGERVREKERKRERGRVGKARTNLFGEGERGDRLCKLWVSGCSGKDGEEDDGKMRMKRDGKDRFTGGRKRKREGKKEGAKERERATSAVFVGRKR